LLRVAQSQIQLAEDIGLLQDTLENRLPTQRQTVRKSQKHIGKFGALSTQDAIATFVIEKRQKIKEVLTQLHNPLPYPAISDALRAKLDNFDVECPPLLPNLEEDYS
jgi:hypothetical protein